MDLIFIRLIYYYPIKNNCYLFFFYFKFFKSFFSFFIYVMNIIPYSFDMQKFFNYYHGLIFDEGIYISYYYLLFLKYLLMHH